MLHNSNKSPVLILLASYSYFLFLHAVVGIEYEVPDECYDVSRIQYDAIADAKTSSPSIELLNASKTCDELESSKDLTNFQLCPPNLLEFHVTPIEVYDPGNTFPYMQLNISVTSHVQVTALYIRLQCIYAPDGDDTYCHNQKRMIVDGRWLWPCRGILVEDAELQLPFRFGYRCFRLFARSQYYLNATIFPHNCRTTILVTTPTDWELFPTIKQFYDDRGAKQTEGAMSGDTWSPLLIVDFSDDDGVWFRIARAPDALARVVTINVFRKELNDGVDESLLLVQSLDINYPYTGIKWQNVPSGRYFAYAFVQRHDCLLICEKSIQNCRMCSHTEQNFTVAEHRAGLAWRAVRSVRDSSNKIAAFALVLLMVMFVAGVVYVMYVQRRAKRRLLAEPRELPLTRRVRVLMLYADDCEEHVQCVSAMGDVLRAEANARVFFDADELNAPGAKPSRWLIEGFCKAEKCVVVISPCVPSLFGEGTLGKADNGDIFAVCRRLRQRRPFPDLFLPGIEMVIRECTKVTSSIPSEAQEHLMQRCERFAIVRLPYSPPIPTQLDVLGLKSFKLPEDFARLTAFLHDVDPGEGEVHLLTGETLRRFDDAVDRMKFMMNGHPDWKEWRWEEEAELFPLVKDDLLLADLPLQEKHAEFEDDGQRTQIATEFGILPPDRQLIEDASKFEILPPDSDSDS